MITVTDLRFEYPGTVALRDISFSIRERSITALVGPNGAGKTTLLRCLAALELPVSGAISIDGVDVLEDPRSCHRKVGYLSDFFGLYDDLTVRQSLSYMSMAHGIPEDLRVSAISRVANRLEISDRLDEKAKALSRGLRQRLAIAQAIIHEPEVILLDEPASGLDPEARHSLAGLFKNLMEQGMTLIVSSHILTELEEYSTDMLVIRDGRIIEQRSIAGNSCNNDMRIRISLAHPFEEFDRVLRSFNGVSDMLVAPTGASFNFTGSVMDQGHLLKKLVQAGVPVCAFAEEEPDMHQAYLRMIKEDRQRVDG